MGCTDASCSKFSDMLQLVTWSHNHLGVGFKLRALAKQTNRHVSAIVRTGWLSLHLSAIVRPDCGL